MKVRHKEKGDILAEAVENEYDGSYTVTLDDGSELTYSKENFHTVWGPADQAPPTQEMPEVMTGSAEPQAEADEDTEETPAVEVPEMPEA